MTRPVTQVVRYVAADGSEHETEAAAVQRNADMDAQHELCMFLDGGTSLRSSECAEVAAELVKHFTFTRKPR